MDTGDLRELARAASQSASQISHMRRDLLQVHASTRLNSRDDHSLRRCDPDGTSREIGRRLDNLERDFQDRSSTFERRARSIELAERVTWRPFLGSVALGALSSQWRQMPAILARQFPLTETIRQFRIPGALRVFGGGIKVAQQGVSFTQRSFGLVKRGWNWLKNKFRDVTNKIVETARGAWNRIWSRTASMLLSAVHGLRQIVASGVRVVVNGIKTAVSTIGRWAWTGAKKVFAFAGRAWDVMNAVGTWVFTLVDVAEIVSLAKRLVHLPAKLAVLAGKLGRALRIVKLIGPIFDWIEVGVNWIRYGIADARLWRSLFKALAGIAIGFAAVAATGITVFGFAIALPVIAKVALASLVLFGSMWIGDWLGNRIRLPFINNGYEGVFEQTAPKSIESIGKLTGMDRVEANAGRVGSVPAPEPVGYADFFDDGREWQKDWIRHDNGYDQWNFSHDNDLDGDGRAGNCTSFVAWRLNKLAHDAGHEGYLFNNNTLKMGDGSEFNTGRMGDARYWDDAANAVGIKASRTPTVGSVLVEDHGTWGHVSIVKSVNPDGSIVVEESGWDGDQQDYQGYAYNVRTRAVDDFIPNFLSLLP